jgi:hypothetical protein
VRELHATAAASVQASVERCLALLGDVEAYPSWCGEVVEAAERDAAGPASRARVTLRLGRGPVAGRFHELMEVEVLPPHQVSLARVPHQETDPERFEVRWELEPGPQTLLTVELDAVLDIPRLLPLGGLADSVAQELVAAAIRALSPRSPIASASSS